MKNSFKKLIEEHGTGYATAIYAVAIVFLLVLFVGLLALEAWIAMLLWNAILPALFTFVGPHYLLADGWTTILDYFARSHKLEPCCKRPR